jgi:NAD(P)-dependent dehydrogenase (short-subunit alcohol dehydrogenase family)
MRLKNKVAIITGAGSGFGKEIAMTFAKEGAEIVAADINFKAAELVAKLINDTDGKCLPIQVDVSDEIQVKNMVQETINKFSKIDILINNAGLSRAANIQDISLDDWNMMIKVNLTGTFLCCKAVIDHMIEREYGKIVNMASISAQTGRPVGVDYSASKSGIVGITRTLAVQVAKYGINVNAIAPGPIQTPLFNKNYTPEAVERLKATIPFKRQGEPKDVANLALFLASDESGWITGEVIAINGGAFMG